MNKVESIDMIKCQVELKLKDSTSIMVDFEGESNLTQEVLEKRGKKEYFGIWPASDFRYTGREKAVQFLYDFASKKIAIVDLKMIKFDDVISAEIVNIKPFIVKLKEVPFKGGDF